MPPFYFLFPELPAEEYNATITEVREVAKPHVQIFDEDPHFLNGLEVGADLMEARNVQRAYPASAAIRRLSARFSNIVHRTGQYSLGLADGGKSGVQLRDQVIGLRQSKKPAMFLVVVGGHGSFLEGDVPHLSKRLQQRLSIVVCSGWERGGSRKKS